MRAAAAKKPGKTEDIMTRKALAIIAAILIFSASYALDSAPAEVDFDTALKNALESGASVKQAYADLNAARATVEKTYGMFDLNLKGGVNYIESKTEATSSFSPEETHVLSYSAGLSNKLFTGGFLSVDLTSDRTSLFFAPPSMSIPGLDFSSLLAAYNPSYKPTLSVTYTQPLLNGFWGRPDEKAIKIGELSIKLAQEGLKSAITKQVSSLKEAYFLIYLTDSMLKIQNDFFTDAKNLYNETVSLKKIGLREETDILQAKASMLSSQAELPAAENNLKAAKEMFLNAAGYPAEQWEKISVAVTETVEDAYVPLTLTADLEETLVTLQSEAVMAKTSYDMAVTGKEIADNSSLPGLNLIGKYGLEGVDGILGGAYDKMWSNKYHNFLIGANFSWSIPTGPVSAAQRKRKRP